MVGMDGDIRYIGIGWCVAGGMREMKEHGHKKPIIYQGEIVNLSFDEVYEKFDRLVYSIVLKMCRGDHEFEDILQAARIGLWDAYKTYDVSKGFTFTTYAGRIAEQKVKLFWRSRRAKKNDRLKTVSFDRHAYGPNDSTVTYLELLPAELPDYDTVIDVRKTLSRMDMRRRTALVAYFVNGIPQEEIGRNFGVRQAQANRIIKKAKAEFKIMYAQ